MTLVLAGSGVAYAVVWFFVARHLFLTHEAPAYQWEHRDYRRMVATESMFYAALWPFGLIYLGMTLGRGKKSWM